MTEYALNFSQPGNFAYDPDNPTYYTEMLSHGIQAVLADLSALGGRICIETAEPATQEADLDAWLAEFRAWLKTNAQGLAAWQNEPEESRGLPVIVAMAGLPATIGGATTLSVGLAVKLVTSIVADVTEAYTEFRALSRDTELNRILDTALYDSSWWSGRAPKLDRLISSLEDGGWQGLGSDAFRCLEGIQAAIENQQQIIKLLSHVVVSANGKIESQEFCFPADVGLVVD